MVFNFCDTVFISVLIVLFPSSLCLLLFIQVLSVTLDEWSDGDIDSMVEVGGNSYANSIYEAFLPKGYPKPKADSSYEDRTNFIRLVENKNIYFFVLSFIFLLPVSYLEPLLSVT